MHVTKTETLRKRREEGRSPALETSLPPFGVMAAGAILYFALALFTIKAGASSSFAPLWYGDAVAVVGLLLLRRSYWPVFLIAIATANTAGNLVSGFSLLKSLAFIPGNLLTIWLSAWWITGRQDIQNLTSSQGAFTSLVVWAMFMPAVAGSILNSAALFGVSAIPPGSSFPGLVLSDLNGLVVVIPLAFAIFLRQPQESDPYPDAAPQDTSHLMQTVRLLVVWAIALSAIAWSVVGSIWPLVFITAAASLVAASTGFTSATLLTVVTSLSVGLFANREMLAIQRDEIQYTPNDLRLALLLTVMLPLYVAVIRRMHANADKEVRARTAELEEERVRYGTLFNESPDAYFVISASSPEILECNRAAERMLGTTRDNIIGRSAADFQPEYQPNGERTTDLIAAAVASMEATGTARLDMLRHRPDGTEFWVAGSVRRSVAKGRKVNLWIWRDITERKRMEGELTHARDTSEIASKAKSEFLATMSHEIRTPLNAIINTSYLLRQGETLPHQEKDLETIEVAAKSLQMVVNDVLDISKIEAGEFSLDIRPFSLVDLVSELGKLFEASLQRRNVTFEVAGELDSIPRVLLGDADCIRHVLSNLLSNAAKFTAHGSVRLTVKALPEAGGPGRQGLRLEVEDTGVGIPQDKLDKLFNPFIQADSSTRRKYGGTGLGLSIVKRLAELMGGRVGVRSVQGQGSTFWFEVELGVLPEAAASRRSHEQLSGGLQVGFHGGSEADQARFAALCAEFGWAAWPVRDLGAMAALPSSAREADFDVCVTTDRPSMSRPCGPAG